MKLVNFTSSWRKTDQTAEIEVSNSKKSAIGKFIKLKGALIYSRACSVTGVEGRICEALVFRQPIGQLCRHQ